jgi:maltoporin
VDQESSQDATCSDILLRTANEAGFAKSSWDLRLYDVPPARQRSASRRQRGGRGQFGDQVDDTHGVAFNFVHTAERFLDERSINKLSLQAGTGPARTFNSGFEVYESAGGIYILPELEESWRFRATEHFVLQPCEWLSYGPVLAYEYTDFDQQDSFGGTRHWLSAGIRPVIHFTRNLSLALGGGVDWTDTDGHVDSAPDSSGALWKITVAPQVSLDRFFLSRPSIRVYLTYAGWADGYQGAVGGPDYVDRTDGLAFGIQMETWW